MSTKLFVGSLPWAINDQTLKEAFEAHGNVVSAKVVTDRATGRSRGFGFVEMSTEKEAKETIEKLNRYALKGRNIVVKEALPKPNYTSGGGGKFDRNNKSGKRRY